MARYIKPVVLCAMLRLPFDSVSTDVVTVAQRDIQRAHHDRPSTDVSTDGRYVAFTSFSRLVFADTNDTRDVYVLERATGLVTLESGAASEISDRHGEHPDISGNGRFLVYQSQVHGGHAEPLNILLRDRHEGSSRILSRGRTGDAANGASRTPSISGDGQWVAFTSTATNLDPDFDANGASDDVYVAHVPSGMIRRVSVQTGGMSVAHGSSFSPAVSATGRYIAFVSSSDLDPSVVDRALVHQATVIDVYVHDTHLRTTKRISIANDGRRANGGSLAPAISADGKYVAFVSDASNLTIADQNRLWDVFVTDWQRGSVELVSRSKRIRSGNDASYNPAISADGRFVAFQSDASDLVCIRCAKKMDDINLLPDVFLFDRQTNVLTRVSADKTGSWMEPSGGPALDSSARVIAFSSRHPTNAADSDNDFDLFVVPLASE